MEKDWAQKLIDELTKSNIADACDATRNFITAYNGGDSVESWNKFSATAKRTVNFNSGCLLVFADNSCYADWNEGIDRFYPDTQDLAAIDDDVKNCVTADFCEQHGETRKKL